MLKGIWMELKKEFDKELSEEEETEVLEYIEEEEYKKRIA